MRSFVMWDVLRAGFVLGFYLALLEIGLRLFNPAPARAKVPSMNLARNIRCEIRNDRISRLAPLVIHSKNSLGFRGPEPPSDFASALTLFVVGGSTVECKFLSDGKDWPMLVANRLKPEFPALWLNNAGLDGHSTFGHLLILKQYLIPMKPKAILFMTGPPDQALDDPNQFETSVFTRTGGPTLRNKAAGIIGQSEILSLLLNLRRKYQALHDGVGHGGIDLGKTDHLPDPAGSDLASLHQKNARALAGYRSRLSELAAICRRNGVEPIFITHPALFGPGIDPFTGVDLATTKVREGVNGRTAWISLGWYNQVTREVAKSANSLLIDLAAEMPRDSRYFYDYLHVTEEGATRMAEIVHARLLPFLVGTWPAYFQKNPGPGAVCPPSSVAGA
jgi:hypothetical protein